MEFNEQQENVDLFYAFDRRDYEELQSLVIAGADIDTENEQGDTPLFISSFLGEREMCGRPDTAGSRCESNRNRS